MNERKGTQRAGFPGDWVERKEGLEKSVGGEEEQQQTGEIVEGQPNMASWLS